MVTSAEGVAVLVAIATLALAARATVPTRRTVLAAGPWTVTAALTLVAARTGVYDVLAIDATPITVTAAVTALAAGSWAGCAELANLREVPYQDRYLAATGGAVAVILGVTLVFHTGFEPLRLVWLVIPPVGAALLAALGYFVLGLIYTDALAELRLAGLYTLAVVVFDGAASVVVVEQLGLTETAVLTTALRWLVDAAVAVDLSGVALLPAHLGVGIGFVAICGWTERKRDGVGLLCALVGSIVVLWSSTVVLVAAVLLG